MLAATLDRLYYVIAAAVLAGCFLCTAALIAGVAEHWDPCIVVASAIFLPIPITLGATEYLAMTRGGVSLNRFVARFLAVLAAAPALSALFVIPPTMLLILSQGNAALGIELSGILVGLAAALGFACWLHERSANRCAIAAPIVWQFSLREIGLFVAALGSLIFLAGYFIRTSPPQFAENVPRERAPYGGLPPSARDVTYFQHGFRAPTEFEFTVEESEFVTWVKSGVGTMESNAAGITLRPITGPLVVHRCPGGNPIRHDRTAVVTNGLIYTWSKGDHAVSAIYDRDTGRAYYYCQTN